MLTRQMRSDIAGIELLNADPIAIIGMDCRFPGGANSPEAYWRLLHDQVDAIREAPTERWGEDAIRDLGATPSDAERAKQWGGFIDRVDQFDPYFFGISPREAISMDPQHRLLLEVAWAALENAGQPQHKLAGSQTGVFVSIYQNDFSWHLGRAESLDAYGVSGNAHSLAVNRLSYLFDFQGPSLAIDTACSSSLVAMHLACASLRSGECDLALAGGVNLILVPASTEALVQWGMLAADGRCKTFDQRADGFVRGEGCGVIVLKRLASAIADGDPILAVVRSTAVNQDGKTNVFTAPNGLAQQAVLRAAVRAAMIEPSEVTYVEAHGTGTSLGDPIEVEAIREVYGQGRTSANPCMLGAVKSNIGHLEAAAGIAGLIKAVLCLHHEAIPANLHFTELNPHITLDPEQFIIPTALTPWPRSSTRRYAAVSSFGMGGTNAHAILEEAPQFPSKAIESATPAVHMVVISAKSAAALRDLAAAYVTALGSLSQADLADMCATASLRRSHHDHRIAVVGSTPPELAAHLAAWLEGQANPAVLAGQIATHRRPRLAFVFSGQGSQWIGMGRDLLEHNQTFQTMFNACAEALAPLIDWSPHAVLTAEDPAYFEDIAVIQPMLWALQVALAAVWRARGITADVVIGHSMGEVAAATVAGVLDLATAARIIAERSRLMTQVVGQGMMAVVELSATDAQAAIAPYADCLAVAVSNSPRSTVLSGDPAALGAVMKQLEERDIFCRYVKVTVASHSPQMAPLCAELQQILTEIQPKPGQIPLVSTVTGASMRGADMNARYWARNLREMVQFSAAVAAVAAQAPTVFVEISPHPVLLHAIEQTLREQHLSGVAIPTLRNDQNAATMFAEGLGAIYVQGATISWSALYPARHRVLPLPNYPWQRDRFWPEPAKNPLHAQQRPTGRKKGSGHPLLGELRLLAHDPQTQIYESAIDSSGTAYLSDHSVQGVVIFPAAGYIELCLAAGARLFSDQPFLIEDLSLSQMLVLDPKNPAVVQVIVDQKTASPGIQVFSRVEGSKTWRLHASARVRCGHGDVRDQPELATVQAAGVSTIDVSTHYRTMASHGLEYGPAFRAVKNLWTLPAAALGKLELATPLRADLDAYHIHPVLLDACFQLLAAAVAGAVTNDADSTTFLPVGVDQIALYSRPGAAAWGYVRMRAIEPDETVPKGDAYVFDAAGRLVFIAQGLRIQSLASAAPSNPPHHALYTPHWEAQQLPAEQVDGAGTWVIFTNGSDVAQIIHARLADSTAQVVKVVAGASYAVLEPDLYQIDSAQPADFQRLLSDIHSSDLPPLRGVVYLWGLGGPNPASASVEDMIAAQQDGVIGALHVVQALAQSNRPDAPRLWIITQGAQQVDQEQPLTGIDQAPLWGFGRTLHFEQADLQTTLIDLSPASGSAELEALHSEFTAPGLEKQIALRDGGRFVCRLRRWKAADSFEDYLSQTAVFQADASYLIVGGLSGLGLAVAEWMATQGARHLVLVGRSQPTASALQAVERLSRLGVQVLVEQADVSEAASIAAVFAKIDATLPPLRGLVHSAVVLDDGMIAHQNQARFRQVMAAKLEGSWSLHLHTYNRELDFFVLFSSAASILGSPGQASYAAANAFQDALAHYRRTQGLPATTINWGPWAEIGQAAAQDNRGARLETQGVLSLTRRQGLELFSLLVQSQPTQIAIIPLDLAKWQPLLGMPGQPPLLVDLVRQALEEQPQLMAAQSERTFRLTLAGLPPTEHRGHIEHYLRKQVAEVLRIPEHRLDSRQPISTLGMDSLMSLELKNRIEATAGVSLSAVRLLQGPSVSEMIEELLQALDHPDETVQVVGVALPLVALQPHGTRPPFFCIHGAMGYTYGYADLARELGPDQPFYGLEARGLDGQAEPLASVEEMASYYLSAIRTVQPLGPYLLGGASFGGVIAFEMACQLQRQGEKVGLLAMMDSIRPSSTNASAADMDDVRVLIESAKFIGYFFGTSLIMSDEELARLNPNEQIDYMVAQYQATDSWPAFMDSARTRSFLKVFRAILQANKLYMPGQYRATITFFGASDGLPEGLMPPEFPEGDLAAAWEECSTEPLVIYNVPGDHVTMVKEPNIRVLASLMRYAIDLGLN
ncbi:MAG: SDR family NAD(P)-dependent oxidoreductase [Herpetosiphonaceae bacterium]|nr:SDR family NAD(P)-dependent oxidoreductase [Herpetosiphonaceae bacterium]